jgi:hypothetical protein
MRATLVSKLINQVAFSFEPDGLLYILVNRFSNGDDNVILEYSRLQITYTKSYTREEAMTTPVFVYNSVNHTFLTQQPEHTVFEIDISSKREVLIEKDGTHLKSEFKRLQDDPVYFYLKYCEIRH